LILLSKRFSLPEPGDAPFGPDFEEQYSAVFDELVRVCDKCFGEYQSRIA
jgi:hypothetical protein